MVFQFEHVDLDYDEHGKWTTRRYDLRELMKNLSEWSDLIVYGTYRLLDENSSEIFAC